MRQNIELKVRHPELEIARAAAQSLGARHTWTRPQRDTYFRVTGARLKTREMPESAELIAYWRADTGAARDSHYVIWPVTDTKRVHKNLSPVWPLACVVEKTRELWMWHNVRIHLDTVVDLGTFVELEGVVGEEADASASTRRVEDAIAALNLRAYEYVPLSYSNLILERLHGKPAER